MRRGDGLALRAREWLAAQGAGGGEARGADAVAGNAATYRGFDGIVDLDFAANLAANVDLAAVGHL